MSVFLNTELKDKTGQLYRFLGKQWAKVLPSGKTGQMASRQVAIELDNLAAKQHYTTGPSVFDNLLLRGIRTGIIPARTQEARDWFRGIAKTQTDISTRTLLAEKTRLVPVSKIEPGKMYFFSYYPKHEKKLPYWDAFPLIFPIEQYSDSFLGINFHYLPLILRAKLMDALYTISTDKRYDENTKLKISYQTLKGVAKFKVFEPTLHKYLVDSTYLKSNLIEIFSSEWDLGLFLPVASFKKASQTKVWRDSQNKLK